MENTEPELNRQSSVPPASARKAATCFSAEQRGMKEQDFLHSGEDMRALMQLYFSRLISCSNAHSRTKERKPICCVLIHCSLIPSNVQRTEAVLVDSRDGWRLQSSRDQLLI